MEHSGVLIVVGLIFVITITGGILGWLYQYNNPKLTPAPGSMRAFYRNMIRSLRKWYETDVIPVLIYMAGYPYKIDQSSADEPDTDLPKILFMRDPKDFNVHELLNEQDTGKLATMCVFLTYVFGPDGGNLQRQIEKGLLRPGTALELIDFMVLHNSNVGYPGYTPGVISDAALERAGKSLIGNRDFVLACIKHMPLIKFLLAHADQLVSPFGEPIPAYRIPSLTVMDRFEALYDEFDWNMINA
ncbi:MAG: hypothetical protein ACQR33_05430 [Candidatus Saccharibacteria bacterium]